MLADMTWLRGSLSLVSLLVLVVGCPGDDGAGQAGSTTTTTTTAGSTGADPSGSTTVATGADATTGDDTGEPGLPERLGVTADWQARTLSVLDLDAIAAGASTRDDLVARTIDLSAYAPGPLQVELAPDGLTAVVSVSPGFYGGFVGSVIGVTEVEQDGTLLIVDLATEAIIEVATVHVPMGIAIEPSGARAFTANYGLDDPVGTTMSVVDLVAGTVIEEVEVGARPEQVSLSADGSLGMLNVVGLAGVRVFQTADPGGSLSEPLALGSDPSDVAFVPGTSFAVVTNSLDPSNYVVVDVADPAAPAIVATGPSPLGSFYAATSIPGTTDVLLTASDFSTVYLFRVTIGADGTPTEAYQVPRTGSSFPLGVAVDVVGQRMLIAEPGTNVLVVRDLGGGGEAEVVVPWQDAIGPTYVAVAGG